MELAVWGANSYGQLGIGTSSELVDKPMFLEPAKLSQLPPLDKINVICGGGGHSLFLTRDGEVYGCGWNKAGQLLADLPIVFDIILLPHLVKHKVIQLATRWDSCFAVTDAGLCLGWGSNAFGQLGLPSDKVSIWEPTVLAEGVRQVDCGARHTVILLKNGTVLTAGDNKFGRLGQNQRNAGFGFEPVPNLKNVKLIVCGFNHNIALAEDNKIYVWGCNKWGQLGKDPKVHPWIESPEELIGFSGNLSSIHAGWSSTHLLTEGGTVLNFGRNNYGQLGQIDNPQLKSWEFHYLPGILKLAVGSEHAVGLNSEGKLVSWGWNEHGSCGNGSVENQFFPTDVSIDKSLRVCKFFAASGFNHAILERQ